MHGWPKASQARFTHPRKIRLILLVVTLVVGVCFWWITDAYNHMLRKEVRQETSAMLNTHAASLKLTLERRLLLADGLKAYVNATLAEGRTLDQACFDTFAGSFIGSTTGVRYLAMYPDGIAKFIYPLGSNESVLGMNLFASPDPAIRQNADQTKASGGPSVLGPMTLKNGGLGMISRQAVFDEGRFWGFVSVVLDIPPMLGDAGLAGDGGIDMAVRAGDRQIFGRSDLFADSSVHAAIEVAGSRWELAARPGKAKLNAIDARVRITALSGLLVLVLLNYLLYVLLTKRQNLQRMVKDRTVHLTEANQRLEATYGALIATEDELRQQNTLLEHSERKLRQVAYRDAVTGLYNRTYFQERLEETIALARSQGQSFALLFLDLDQFKLINDTLGHACGDLLLQEVGCRLSGLLHEDELFSRIGGDEFTIILPAIADAAQLQEAAQQVVDLFQQPFVLNDIDYFVTASIGVTLFPDHGDDAAQLMKYADAAMYRAKEEGKNNFRLYDDSLIANADEKIYIKNSLRRALDNGEFEVHYQPQIEIESKRIVGLEALIRWNHPKRGSIPPSLFIPIAEESGLMEPIGEWVLRSVCHQNKAWQDAGLPPVRTAVNLSARQFGQRNRLSDQIKGILAESGLDPAYLELEITENTAMRDDNSLTLQELRNLAITISIDDFGTHYSSLNYLKRLPVDKIKIDRSFVNGIRKEPKDEAIILAMLLMASHLNLTIVAEGVETQEQLDFLQDNRCNDIQGYLYYPPQPAAAMARILREHGPNAA
ncbi:bifunctional diguanylate cyclase/phosphodiesterase [Paenibacillus glycinis]|uniref:EAL domain-containing protein n=1 Tax=Paenibacillus glycinis TaxID=2697035 RepID=A0ABW9XRK6_9BACL|nr:EAL domain-containing protein [Paenibacillus glycinis]NBD25291.1 EAL domain-containing protein [Paenibacillus glycinis]